MTTSRAVFRLIIPIVGLTLLYRWLSLPSWPLWEDELFSVYWSKLGWGFLLSRGLLIETNPPFYYILLKAWCLRFGSGETSVRLLSVLASTLAVLALYILGARLGGRAVGLISAAAFAISPLQIHYAYEVRAYALLPLLFIVTCIGIAAILEPHPPPSTTRLGGLIGYVSGAVCMVYSHATMIVPLFSLFVVTAFELRARRAELYRFLAFNLLLGLLQGALILAIARLAFEIPLRGSLALIAAAASVFAAANLALGFLFSSLARVQMQAMQMTFFFFLPSSLLSGFMFPFSAMPTWAQALGEALPLTHFLRIIRGVTLRNVDAGYVIGELVPIAAFALVAGFAALLTCRRALRAGPT